MYRYVYWLNCPCSANAPCIARIGTIVTIARNKDTGIQSIALYRLRYSMRQNVEERVCIAKQLASNSTLSKAQQAALEHIFGSDVFVAGPPPAARHPRAFWPQIFFQIRSLLWGACELPCVGHVRGMWGRFEARFPFWVVFGAAGEGEIKDPAGGAGELGIHISLTLYWIALLLQWLSIHAVHLSLIV